jgi:hypothetical protein
MAAHGKWIDEDVGEDGRRRAEGGLAHARGSRAKKLGNRNGGSTATTREAADMPSGWLRRPVVIIAPPGAAASALAAGLEPILSRRR